MAVVRKSDFANQDVWSWILGEAADKGLISSDSEEEATEDFEELELRVVPVAIN